MQIRFENRLEDVLAFNEYHHAASATAQRARLWTLVMVALAGVLMSILVTLQERTPVPLAVGAVLVPLGLVLLNRYYSVNLRRVSRRLMSEGANKALYGWHELELDGDQLTKRSLYVTSIMDLRLIEKIVERDDYAFIYISAISALVVPRRDVPEADYEEFLEELRERWSALKRRVERV